MRVQVEVKSKRTCAGQRKPLWQSVFEARSSSLCVQNRKGGLENLSNSEQAILEKYVHPEYLKPKSAKDIRYVRCLFGLENVIVEGLLDVIVEGLLDVIVEGLLDNLQTDSSD